MRTDSDWEKWGATDPYFGVYSDERFRSQSMDGTARAEFFQSGEAHVDAVMHTIRSKFDPGFAPRTAMDFGSGVGRLVIPMARRMTRVLGVDVSPSMIAEASRNCRQAHVTNVEFASSNDTLSTVNTTFDLVHSYIVLQHIPWRRGRKILQALSQRVTPGGYLAVQMLTGCHERSVIRSLVQLRYALPPLNWLRNLLRSRPIFEPQMQLHVYRLTEVLGDLRSQGFDAPLCLQENLHGIPFDSTLLYARRAS